MDRLSPSEGESRDAPARLLCRAAWLAVLGATAALYAASLLLGDLNQDEGWYLYAARLVSEGRLPYLDFASTQGPVMSFVYVLARPLVERLGVAGGRLFTALLGLAATVLAAVLAPRLIRSGGSRLPASRVALLAFALVGVNVYHAYFTTMVKTYSLTAVFLMSGFLCLSCVEVRGKALPAFLAGVFLMLSAATRTSAGAVIPCAWLFLLFGANGETPGRERRAVAWRAAFAAPSRCFVSGVVLTALCVLGPFMLLAPDGVWFAWVEYHSGRSPGGLLAALAYKAGFVARMILAYMPAVAVGLYLLARAWHDPAERRNGGQRGHGGRRWAALAWLAPRSLLHAAWLSVAAVSLLHMIAPFPYDDYQTIVYPLAGAALAAGWGGGAGRLPGESARRDAGCTAGRGWGDGMLVAIVFVFLAAFSSPMLQGWFVGARDRIWWPLKQETPLANLQRAGRLVNALAGPDGEVLTQDTYLAVETGLSVPAGLELGPFSYFPEWSNEKAARLHVLNREMFHRLLETSTARVAAFSGYGLAIRCPSVTEIPPAEQRDLWSVVERRYAPEAVIPGFGQASTDLRVMVLGREDRNASERADLSAKERP